MKLKVLSSTPCMEAWDTMRGNARERHCEVCDKPVHDFAAMTETKIHELIRRNDGHLCARRVHRADGTLVTLEAAPKPAIAAGVVLAASMVCGAAAAQSLKDVSPTARLSGTVLVSDGSEPKSHAEVALLDKDKTVATAQTDEKGQFSVSVVPGRYDILIWQNILFRQRIPNVELHAGEQSLQAVKLPALETENAYATVGQVIAISRYPISFLFKHPILYLKNIRHQI